MSDAIKVQAAPDGRSPEEAARAAPVSLPAGSYDSAELDKALSGAVKAKPEDRDAAVAAAVAKVHVAGTDHSTGAVPEGYQRVDVDDEVSGVKESRIVPIPAEEEKAAQPPASVPVKPAVAADTKE